MKKLLILVCFIAFLIFAVWIQTPAAERTLVTSSPTIYEGESKNVNGIVVTVITVNGKHFLVTSGGICQIN